jgi:hypothetical protein
MLPTVTNAEIAAFVGTTCLIEKRRSITIDVCPPSVASNRSYPRTIIAKSKRDGATRLIAARLLIASPNRNDRSEALALEEVADFYSAAVFAADNGS